MFMVVATLIVLTVLLLVTAMRPLRDDWQAELLSLQRIIGSTLLIIIFSLLIVTFGWGWGIVTSLFVVLFYGAIARLVWMEQQAARIYRSIEPALLQFIRKFPGVFRVLRAVPRSEAYHSLNSRQELERMVKESKELLTSDEKKIILNSLTFDDRQVNSIMTPRSAINTIAADEFLGPLVLDELHEQGTSRLPVIKEDIDHVVGVLHIKDLLSLDIKKSGTAQEVMDPKVFYIHEDDTLGHALAAFLRTRRHLFIVVNEFRETVGLLTLEDVMEVLLGRKIIDEDDNHDDLRAVAARNPKKNNRPAGHVDV